jgi:hypothetical protein
MHVMMARTCAQRIGIKPASKLHLRMNPTILSDRQIAVSSIAEPTQ